MDDKKHLEYNRLHPKIPIDKRGLLEALKKEYSQTGLSEVEATLLLKAIEEEKDKKILP